VIRRALLALVVVVALGACEVRTEVGVEVEEDGSGVVRVAVALDDDAVRRFPGLEQELRLEDLRATGWEITGPTAEADGRTWIRGEKPFATPEDAGRVLAEVAGENGPFRDFVVTRERSFARTSYSFRGTVDFTGGIERFGDDALAEALDGEPLGEDVAAIEERIGAAIDEAFTFRVAVRLPGDVTGSNAPTEAENGAVWEPRLSEEGPIELTAESEVTRTGSIALVVLAVLAGIAAVLVVAGFPWRRRRKARRRHGRHAGQPSGRGTPSDAASSSATSTST
jgi:hypothetical protein